MCKAAQEIVEKDGEAIQIRTSDGWCPTRLYYHIQSCNECIINSENINQLGGR